ncbi:hypothetical protein D9M72_479700 [compost metagenome]
MLGAQAAKQPLHSGVGHHLIGHNEEQHALAEVACHIGELLADVASGRGQRRGPVDFAKKPFQVGLAGFRGQRPGRRPVAAHEPHHVAVTVGKVAHHAQGHHGNVLLLLAAERGSSHVASGIRDQHHCLPPHCNIALDERGSVPGRGFPVDVADFVSGNVGPEVVKVQAAALENGTVFAVEHSACLAVGEDRHLRFHPGQEAGHAGALRESGRTPRWHR